MTSIFVSIISQDEDFLEETILDALHKSSGKNNINLGVIEQRQDNNFIDPIKNESVKIKKIRCIPRGVGISRSESMEMYAGEDYILVIDAHTMFDKNWDETLINNYIKIDYVEGGDVIISQRLPKSLADGTEMIFLNEDINLSKKLYFDGIVIRDQEFTEDYVEHYAVTCHFIFGKSTDVLGSPFDPRIYYLAEESLLSMRLWTNGCRIFAIKDPPMISLNKPLSKIKNDWRDSVDAERMVEDFKILMDYLYWGIIDEWSAKDFKSLEEFKKKSGIDISCVFNNLNIEYIDEEAVDKVINKLKKIVQGSHFNNSVFVVIGSLASKSKSAI